MEDDAYAREDESLRIVSPVDLPDVKSVKTVTNLPNTRFWRAMAVPDPMAAKMDTA